LLAVGTDLGTELLEIVETAVAGPQAGPWASTSKLLAFEIQLPIQQVQPSNGAKKASGSTVGWRPRFITAAITSDKPPAANAGGPGGVDPLAKAGICRRVPPGRLAVGQPRPRPSPGRAPAGAAKR